MLCYSALVTIRHFENHYCKAMHSKIVEKSLTSYLRSPLPNNSANQLLISGRKKLFSVLRCFSDTDIHWLGIAHM